MVQISDDDVRHLAALSSLELTDKEIERLRNNISDVLRYVEQLDELDTDVVDPSYQVTGLSNVWRDDQIINDGVSREELLDLAPAKHEHQVKVPKVL